MANQPNQKLKLLYILRALIAHTDDAHGITTQELIEQLAYYDIDAERKSISRDINTLRDFGFDIQQRSHKYWYLAKRPLEMRELTMLVDAVQSAPFLTDKLTESLIDSLKQFASDSQAAQIDSRVKTLSAASTDVKMQNESALNNLDLIQQAMRDKRKIAFQYTSYDIKKRQFLRRDGATYLTTPVHLVFSNGFYYLITFDDQAHNNQPTHNIQGVDGGAAINTTTAQSATTHADDDFIPYRVDRMTSLRITDEPATKDPRIANYRPQDHLSPSFGIYAADKVPVVLEVDATAMNAIIDKFGIDAVVFEKEADRARVSVKAPTSPQFFGWLLQLGSLAKLVYPQDVITQFTDILANAQLMYGTSYRICSDTARRAITQEQFLEFVTYLKCQLDTHIATHLDGKGFSSENDFDEFLWPLMDRWLFDHQISDGLPATIDRRSISSILHSAPTQAANPQLATAQPSAIQPAADKSAPTQPATTLPPDGKMVVFGPARSEDYLVYGQIVGEAIVALNPRTFATDEARDSFTDVSTYFGEESVVAFTFRTISCYDWEKAPRGMRLNRTHGARYEKRWTEDPPKDAIPKTHPRYRAFFVAPEFGIPEQELRPFCGSPDNSAVAYAIEKHWQMIAYRFN